MNAKQLIFAVATVTSMAIFSVAGLALAQDTGPGDRPPRPERPQHDDTGPRGPKGEGGFRSEGGPMLGGGFGGRRWSAQPSEDEWKQITVFAQEHSPHRLVAIERLRESGEPAYRAAQMFMVVRYRALQQMKEHDPDLYTERVKGLLLEDKVFGAVEDGHAKPEATEEQRNALRDDVKELVSFNLRERADRLERLAQVLETERKKLDDDQNREEELADEKMHAIERDGVKAFQLEGGRRGRGDREGDRGPGPWPEPGGPPPPPAQ